MGKTSDGLRKLINKHDDIYIYVYENISSHNGATRVELRNDNYNSRTRLLLNHAMCNVANKIVYVAGEVEIGGMELGLPSASLQPKEDDVQVIKVEGTQQGPGGAIMIRKPSSSATRGQQEGDLSLQVRSSTREQCEAAVRTS